MIGGFDRHFSSENRLVSSRNTPGDRYVNEPPNESIRRKKEEFRFFVQIVFSNLNFAVLNLESRCYFVCNICPVFTRGFALLNVF